MDVRADMKREGEPRLLQATARLNSFRKKACQNESRAHQKPVIKAHTLRVKLSAF